MKNVLELEENPEKWEESRQEVPWVSNVLPTYNRAVEIKQSIQSILKQTYRKLELIIVNDGSTDNTEQVCRNFKIDGLSIIACQKMEDSAKREIME